MEQKRLQHKVFLLFVFNASTLVFFALSANADDASWFSFLSSHLQIQSAESTHLSNDNNNLAPNLEPGPQAPSLSPDAAASPSSSPDPTPQLSSSSSSSFPAQSPMQSDDGEASSSSSSSTPPAASNNNNDDDDPALADICDKTDYPELCRSSVIPFIQQNGRGAIDRFSVLKLTIDACLNHTQAAIQQAVALAAYNPDTIEIVRVCQESYTTAVDQLKESVLALAARDIGTFRDRMSSVITNIGTCDETFGEDPQMESSSPLAAIDQTITRLASNILAIGERI